MTPERWQQVKEIFRTALGHEVEERAAFLDHACAGDHGLRREVESLLSSFEESDSIIERPVAEAAAKLFGRDQAESLVGRQLGHYQITALLGEGGMGTVYLAQDMRLNRRVAVKVLLAASTSNEEANQRLWREARAAATLEHPHICAIHEIAETDGHCFIVMQYVEGETLADKLRREQMNLREVLNIAVQVADALAAAHDAHIIHRDIKPANIIVNDQGQAKVLDFGLAKFAVENLEAKSQAATARLLSKSGVIMGTVPFMSPEQVQGKRLDARTDIFSFGAMLYEMSCGQQPFVRETNAETISAILRDEPSWAELPGELQPIVQKSLMKNAEERYQTAKDLRVDLKSLQKRLEMETDGSTAPERSGLPSGGKLPDARAEAQPARPTSSAEYLVTEIKRNKPAALLILAMIGVAIITVAYFVIPRYFVSSDKAGVSAPSGAATIRSIAVLPFTNTSGNPDTEYLSDGISESLINSLSQLPGVKVIARSSSFKYKGKETDPQEVATALGVEGILTGRVAQHGENLLISVELMNARDKTQVWGERYNRRTSDVLAVLSEISRDMAEKLRLRLTPVEQRQLVRPETANPQAYELGLKGLFYRRKGGIEEAKKSIEYYNQAIAIDPNYALAYAQLSSTYNFLVGWSAGNPKEFLPKAEAAARKALELDESLADAHVSLASIKENSWDWAGAERGYKRAIELNQNLGRAHILYARYLNYVGRHEQAITEAKHARELDPLSPVINANASVILIFARHYDQAVEALKKTLELDQYRGTHEFLGYTYAAKGMYTEAIAAYQQAIKLGGDTPSTQVYLGAAYARAGERGRAQAILNRLETSKEYVSPGELAILYGALEEPEQAFASLERAYAAHDPQLKYLGVDPAFDPLRGDPRYADLVRRLGLTR